MKKSVFLRISVLAVALFGIVPSAFASGDTSWVPYTDAQNASTFHAIYMEDPLPLNFDFPVLQGIANDNSQNIIACKATTDPACAGMGFAYNSILKVCQSATDTDCVVSLEGVDTSGASSSATFSRYTVTNHIGSYPADPKRGIPAGDLPSVWNLPIAKHASGSDYVIEAGMSGWINPDGTPGRQGSFLSVSLVPVKLKDFGKGPQSQDGGWGNPTPGYYYDACTTFQQTASHTNVNCGHVNGPTCLFPTNDQGLCYVKEDFPPAQRFSVHLRLSKEPNGWLHGRMTDPNVSISHESSGAVDLTVAAGTTSVPMVYEGANWADLNPQTQKYWVDCMNDGLNCGLVETHGGPQDFWDQATTAAGNSKLNLLAFPFSYGRLALEAMSAIAPLTGNKATTSTTSWTFRTLSNSEMNGANKCFTSTPGIKGIVTTNSTTYSAGPPALVNGTLNYQVASPHYLPDGTTPFKGNYNLVIRSDVARCIYGFSQAPISATISVTGADGSDEVATTVVGEADGWMHLAANNFEFSSPTIQVKLTQEGSIPNFSANVAPKTVKKSITCVKGKTTKTVTTATCPSGYKKK
jgi:hypothetical protein